MLLVVVNGDCSPCSFKGDKGVVDDIVVVVDRLNGGGRPSKGGLNRGCVYGPLRDSDNVEVMEWKGVDRLPYSQRESTLLV